MSALLTELHREFGWKSRFYSAVGGPYVLWKLRREQRRLARGWTYEPATFYETNVAGATRPGKGRPTATRCAYVSPGTARFDRPKRPQWNPKGPQWNPWSRLPSSDVALTNRGSWRCWLRTRRERRPISLSSPPQVGTSPLPAVKRLQGVLLFMKPASETGSAYAG